MLLMIKVLGGNASKQVEKCTRQRFKVTRPYGSQGNQRALSPCKWSFEANNSRAHDEPGGEPQREPRNLLSEALHV